VPVEESRERESRQIVWRYLNQGRIDPFRVYSVDNVPEYVDLILDHGKLIPDLSPALQNPR
jgi:hypothetical protein